MANFMRPADLEALRFNARRSHNTSTAPWNIKQAVMDQGRPAVMTLPQSMGQNKWKTPRRVFASSALQVAALREQYATPAPVSLMEPVPFQTQARVSRSMNRLPPLVGLDDMLAEPLSRGVLQRRGTSLANQEELRAVIRHRQDVPNAYDTQDVVQSAVFPSTYVFSPNNRAKFITVQELNGLGRRHR
jgi:hypothetical protein